ncbi:hypothetical protein ACTG9Q_25235 [Actinokineospora sp. 24-640]
MRTFLDRHGRQVTLVASLGAVFLAGCWAAWFFTIDDAFITFRYSENLAEGSGPVWNLGEDPVEGFTNFAWMLWHTPFAWLGLPLETVAKVTSLLIGLAVVALLATQPGGRLGRLVAAGAFLLFVPTYFHVTGGLETVAFAAVLLRAVVVGLRVLDGRPVRVWEPPALLLLAGMLRPEGAVAALPALAVWLWHNRRERAAWVWTAAAAVVGGAYFAWRWSFYGHPFPNTFYVKFGNVAAGGLWLWATAIALAPLLVLTLSLLARSSTRRAGALIVSTVAAAYLTYAVSGPTMDYVHRFAFHAFPVLCLGAGLAVSGWRPRWLAAVAGVAAVVGVAAAGVRVPDLSVIAVYGPDLQRAHVAIGRGLAQAGVPAEARTIAVSDAGAIPYYSDWTTIDYIGLNSEPIAHGANPTDVVTAARPTVVVVTNHSPNVRGNAYGLNIAQATDGYVRIANVRMRENYWQAVFALPQYADRIAGPLAASVATAQATYDPDRWDISLDRWLDRLRTQLPF